LEQVWAHIETLGYIQAFLIMFTDKNDILKESTLGKIYGMKIDHSGIDSISLSTFPVQ
jgi:hypothetical protein